jgi:uncharacterized membrane protein YphA (DoxX/SURF4 family)
VAPADPSSMTRVLATLARLLLGGVWLWAGLAKVTDLDASVRAVRAYDLLPEAVVPALGAALPLVEILLGALLVVGAFVRPAAIVSAVLMAAFVIGIASAWARGLRIDCGCFGSGGLLAADAQPTYGWELARDGGLLLVAILLARWPASRFAVDGLLGRDTAHDERGRRPAGVGTE